MSRQPRTLCPFPVRSLSAILGQQTLNERIRTLRARGSKHGFSTTPAPHVNGPLGRPLVSRHRSHCRRRNGPELPASITEPERYRTIRSCTRAIPRLFVVRVCDSVKLGRLSRAVTTEPPRLGLGQRLANDLIQRTHRLSLTHPRFSPTASQQ